MMRFSVVVRGFIVSVLFAWFSVHGVAGTPPTPVAVAVGFPVVLNLDPGNGHPERGSASLLYEIMIEEMERHGMAVRSATDGPTDIAELARRAAETETPFAAVPYLVQENGRLGFGFNVYHSATGYVVTGRSAYATSEVALARALSSEMETLAAELKLFLESERKAHESEVRTIRLVVAQPGITVSLADGRSFHADEQGHLQLEGPGYRVGQTISFTLQREGYHQQSVHHLLPDNEVVLRMPALAPRIRFAAGGRVLAAFPTGAGAAFRWYPLPDELFFELTGALFRVDASTSLAKDIASDTASETTGGASSFLMSDVSFSLGAYLFSTPQQWLRPGVQAGAGGMRATGGEIDLFMPYLAPLNVFLSAGRARLRGRVVTGFRYIVGGDALDRRWLAVDGALPYVWFEVGYSW